MYAFLLILHFIGLALGLGTSITMFTLGLSTRKASPAERGDLFRRLGPLKRNGSIGLALLLLAGLGMLALRPGLWGVGGWFHAKLALVLVMVALYGWMQVLLKRAGNAPPPARVATLSRINLVLTLAIVVCAVMAFH
jgi:uncharacterized membrane protein SirB2